MPHTQYGARMTEVNLETEAVDAPQRRRTKRWAVPAALGTLLLLAATATYIATTGPEYGSAQEIVDRLAEVGTPCTTPEPRGDGLIRCYVDGKPLVIDVADSPDDEDFHWSLVFAMDRDAGRSGLAAVTGNGWNIMGYNKTYLRKVAVLLDAEYRTS